MKDKKKKIQNVEEYMVNTLSQRESSAPKEVQDEVWQRILLAQRKSQLPFWKGNRFMQWGKVAMAACLIITFGWAYYQLNFKSTDNLLDVVAQMQTSSVDADGNVLLVTASGEKVALSNNSKVISQTLDGKIQVDDEDVETKNTMENATDAFNQVIVPLGKHIKLALADGSLLDINSGTKVIYPQTFKKDIREIYVEGEIFIDVKKANGLPFVVRTSRFDVNVLGTAFNVKAYPKDKDAEVVLQRGKVLVKDSEKRVVEMKPNDLVTLKKGYYVNKKVIDASKYIAWKDGLLIFEGETLAEVTDRLKQFYGIEFYCTSDVKRITLFGKLDINESIKSVLSAIAGTTGVTYELKPGICILKRSE